MKPRLVHVINLAGSARNFIGDQFSYFLEKGEYEMHLICTPDDKIKAFANQHKTRYFPVSIDRKISPLKDFMALWKIFRYLKKNNVDIVVSHQAKSMLLGTVAAWLARVPNRVIMAHGVLVDTMTGWKKRFFVTIERLSARLATNTICVSSSVAKRRLEEGIDREDKQVIVGNGTCNGVDTKVKFNPANVTTQSIECLKQKYGIKKDGVVVGFVGRIVRDKGIVELANGFKVVIEKHPNQDIKLIIVGVREERDAVPCETIDFLERCDNVVFTGPIDYNDIQVIYRLFDVLVLPSYREGFPTVVLEAGAMEVPAIVSRSTGCIDSIVENETGIYTDINAESIAIAIERFLDKRFSFEMGQIARQYIIENYEHSLIREELLKYYNSLI